MTVIELIAKLEAMNKPDAEVVPLESNGYCWEITEVLWNPDEARVELDITDED